MKKAYKNHLSAVFLLILTLTSVTGVGAKDIKKVELGGMPFGIRFNAGELTVSEFCDVDTEKGMICPARVAGLKKDDTILEIDGKDVKSIKDVTDAVDKSGGEPIEFTISRNGNELSLSIDPEMSESLDKFKIGVVIKDGMAGIGTVTYIIPESGEFGGLGHAVCDNDGKLCEIKKGTVSPVTITDVVRGVAGTPGVLKGTFTDSINGTIDKNTDDGVYGIIDNTKDFKNRIIEVAKRDEVKEGNATILCTLDDGGIKEYDVTVSPTGSENMNSFVITIKDEDLIKKTGGIVQGMSGSPVIQNGKLIGAVTHVLISDPTRGYGIYIDEMLNTMISG